MPKPFFRVTFGPFTRSTVQAPWLALFILPVWACIRLSQQMHIPGWLIATSAILISLITYATYAWDKAKAQRGGWRIPETTLHLLDLCGGWPGGLLARHQFRHKTAKLSFRITFWLIVALHQLISLDYVTGHAISRELLGLLGE